MKKQPVIVLASASPRRHELLSRMGVSFVVDAAEVDERCDGPSWEVAQALAIRKSEAVAKRHPDKTVLGADTIVDCGGILGKPADEEEAVRMLRRLSGQWHDVYTGVCVIHRGNMRCEVAQTHVHFLDLTEQEIRRYVATGEPMDKAGAYAIQGQAGMYIDRIDGCPHNVMGLPMAITRQLLMF